MAAATQPQTMAQELDLNRLKDFHGEFEIVPIEKFFVDPTYQRPVTSIARQIADDFLMPLVGTLTVSARTGMGKKPNYALIDGQNRWEGAKGSENPVITELPAVVYKGLTEEDEALIFYLLQDRRRNLTSWQKFKARLVAKDPQSLEIQRIVEDAGFTLNSEDGYRSVQAIGALRFVYAKDARLLENTMWLLYEAWGPRGEPPVSEDGVTSSDMIRGVARFLRDHENADLDRLLRALKATNPTILKSKANILMSGRSAGAQREGAVSEAIYGEYLKAR